MNVVIIITYQNVTVSTLKRTVSVCVTVERAQPGMVLICPHTSHCLIWCVCVCVCVCVCMCVCWDHFRGTGLKPDAPPTQISPSMRPLSQTTYCCGWWGSCEQTNAACGEIVEWSECWMREGECVRKRRTSEGRRVLEADKGARLRARLCPDVLSR